MGIMGFSRQEYWSGFPFPSPEDLPHTGIKPAPPVSPALQADSLPIEPLGKKIKGNTTLFVGLFYKDSVRYYICKCFGAESTRLSLSLKTTFISKRKKTLAEQRSEFTTFNCHFC